MEEGVLFNYTVREFIYSLWFEMYSSKYRTAPLYTYYAIVCEQSSRT